MKIFVRRKTIIKELATELAYLQINADWWYYTSNQKEKYQMSSYNLDLVTEVREIANRLGIISKVYEEAYKIYNFKNSGKENYKPNIELIKELHDSFCSERKKIRVFM